MTTKVLLSLLVGIMVAGILVGCKEEAPPSLYDPNYVSGPQPRITSIDPAAGGLAGVTPLTVTGVNFNAAADKNLLFFDGNLVPILQASTTQLRVLAPALVGNSINVKVAVYGSDLFSDPVLYKLEAAVDEKFGNLAASDEVISLECDNAGNVYASMLASAAGVGVWRFTPAGVKDAAAYSPPFSGAVSSWRGMKFGPGGAMFCVAGRAIIFRIPPGGGASALWVSGSGLTNLNDLDFDQNGNLWTGGASATSIFRVKQDKTVQSFPFVGTVRAVRVYNSFLFVAGKRDSLEKVWRFPITGDNLGAEEEYFNLSSVYGANTFGANGLAFNTDGDLYVGTDSNEGIRIVHPNKSSEQYYTGLLKGSTVYLTWGSGSTLYQGRGGTVNPKTIVKINTQKTSAPYFGRSL